MALLKNQKILMLLGVIALFAIGYFLFVKPTAAPDVTATAAATPAELLFINLAGQLDPIAFDGGVLNDPRFQSLVDIRTQILPETPGRTDPFAPLGR